MEERKEVGRSEKKNMRRESLRQLARGKERTGSAKTLDEWYKRKRELTGEELGEEDEVSSKKIQRLMEEEGEGATKDNGSIIL